MTKAIFFDFWGTLAETGVASPLKQVRSILRINLPFPEYVVRMERSFMTRKFLNLREGFETVCTEFGIPIQDEIIDNLIGVWNKSWMLAKPYPEVQEVLKELSKKYDLFLVANTDCFAVPSVVEKFKLDSYFKKIYYS